VESSTKPAMELHKIKSEVHNNQLYSFISGVNINLPKVDRYINLPVNKLVDMFFKVNPYLLGKAYPTYVIITKYGQRLMIMNGKFSIRDFFKNVEDADKLAFSLIEASSEVIHFEFYELLNPKHNTMNKPSFEKIQEILIDELAETAYLNVTETITSESKMEDLSIDSLDTVEVIMKVEKRLNIKVNDNELDSSIQQMTVGKFAEWINNRIQN
jgi:acyl carrier protein